MFMIRLNAGHTTSGNPKRIYVLMNTGGGLEGAWDEGYSGHNAVPAQYRQLALSARMFETSNREYKEMLRIGKLA